MRRLIASAFGILSAVALALPAGAYYHFLHYTSSSSPYAPIPEKLDLTSLNSNTVVFFVSSAGPAQYSANDNFPSVLSQIRQAAQAWNSVSSSNLRVSFGGLYADGTAQSTPGGEVVFEDEIPPGLLAFSTHTTATTAVTATDGSSFFPITRSIVHMKQDLTQTPGPSYSDGFFLTVVHEMGHALGLQHTFTSSVMSTAVTRSTSLANPLDLDDVTAVSLLYPAAGYLDRTGSITGQVTAKGKGIHMASVVALRMGSHGISSAVSALTEPDGAYRIDGLPPDQYILYTHPIPPTANIVSPLDPDGNSIPPDGPFQTMFLNGASDPSGSLVSVKAGASSDGVNFDVTPVDSYGIYDVTTWSFFGNTPVRPGYVNMLPGYGTLVAEGADLGSGGKISSELNVRVLGGAATPYALLGYGSDETYLAIYLEFALGANPGPEHLVFSQGNDVYVLPAGLHLVSKAPPSVNSAAADVDAKGNPIVTVSGSDFTSGDQVYFDGLPAMATKYKNNSTLQAYPPPGAGGQNATINVYSNDGQNSMFLNPDSPLFWSYPAADAPAVTFSPSSLPAGSEAMVDVTGVNTQFVSSLATLGFGSNDVFVRRIWVVSPTHLLANVSIAPGAPQVSTLTSVISAFQLVSQPAGFQILAPVPDAPVVIPNFVNSVWQPSGIFSGASASVFGSNLSTAAGATTITVNGKPVKIANATATEVDFAIPRGLGTGPAILKLNNGASDSLPIVIQIDYAPPSVSALDSTTVYHAGDTLTVLVSGLDGGTVKAPTRVHISVGGVDHVASVITAPSSGSLYQVEFTLSSALAAGDRVPLTVLLDGRQSLPIYITIQ